MNGSQEKTPTEELILFTRYPRPGRTKTRLIPAIGEEKAAELQRRMTEFLVNQTSPLASDDLRVTISCSDGSVREVKQWLESVSDQLHFTEQTGSDLGERMKNDFLKSFQIGVRRTVIIGTDCPCITRQSIKKSFRMLRASDVVLGPAYDGGYYLIGLSSMERELFSDVDWGTDSVFRQTMERAERRNLTVKTLQKRRDVDRPEDLPHLKRISLPE